MPGAVRDVAGSQQVMDPSDYGQYWKITRTLGPSICEIIASTTPVHLAHCSYYSCFKSQTSGSAVQFRIGRFDHLF